MKNDIRVEWQEWGRRDPFYGVLTLEERSTGGKNPWTSEEFYDQGNKNWRGLQSIWMRYGVVRESCLEIGCGAGRLTAQLGKFFEQVHAIDISAGMIDRAGRMIDQPSVTFSVADCRHLPFLSNSFTAVFSTLVLQHLPRMEDGLRCFVEVYRLLRPGGTFLIQLPLFQFPPGNRTFAEMAAFAYKTYLRLLSVKAYLRRRLVRCGISTYMHGISYEVSAVYQALISLGFERVDFVLQPVGPNGEIDSLVLGTKPGPREPGTEATSADGSPTSVVKR